MTYQVFARKYRPQLFDEVVGQDHIITTLKNAIELNRLAHAYLFVGPRGTGKTSTARIIAKALNCEKGPTLSPCGTCDACKEIAAGTSLDVLEIDGASNNGVEQVRELRDNVRFAPTRGKYKIYIIDEVHMLTSAAFNALLKTLEEPPAHVKFIFATTEPQKVLPTILSRCQRFDLRRIPVPLIAKHLAYIATQEKILLEESAAIAVARGAEGGLRDAESMLDQLVAFCGDTIKEKDVLEVFGFTAQQSIADFAGAILDQDSSLALGQLYDMSESGKDLTRLLGDLLGHFRNLLIYQVDPTGIHAELSEEMERVLEEQSVRATRQQILNLIDLFAVTEGRMKWAPNKRLHFEIGVIKAVETLGQVGLDEILETLTALREGREPLPPRTPPAPRPKQVAPARIAKPAPEQPPEPKPEPVREKPTEPPAPPSVTPEPGVASPPEQIIPPVEPKPEIQKLEPAAVSHDPKELWFALLEAVEEKPTIHSLLVMGAPLSVDIETFKIGFPTDCSAQMEYLLRPANLGFMQDCLNNCSKQELELSFELQDGICALPPPEKKVEPAVDPKEEYLNDPKIKMALEIFKAELLSTE